jgi:hypothetical protein
MADNQYVENLAGAQFCADKNEGECRNCEFCYTPTEASVHSRRCFMTGAYCSKQTNIYREQNHLHKDHEITAFVVMNFSDMSDVVYKWRIKPFIESLTKYLYFDDQQKRLYCSSREVKEGRRVKKIRVIRSDTAPASNYVICSRICQQMQIADIVVVDVSAQNANVFYEFGMAVALGKLILPICYSESFYKMTVPAKIKDRPELIQKVEHHIGCYPWRKDLFEYYGIRYRFDGSKTKYEDFEQITKIEYGFSDIDYTHFPYHESLPDEDDESGGVRKKAQNKEIIGKTIYNRLSSEYNRARYEDNTLVVYTMDAFLNEGQAGLCMVNFYHGITARMRQERCFCGERVGILVQENTVLETEKDAKCQLDLPYSVGEIIQIGLNQATYLAMQDKIDARDCFAEGQDNGPSQEHREEIERFIKGYVRNKGIRIYPNYPVFVDRMKNLPHGNILELVTADQKTPCSCFNGEFFCLYHVMLRTLRYTNEVVVDISNNCLQALFWLGAAHGSDVYAITVIHQKSEGEKRDASEKEPRYIFDVAGLWTAIFRKNDTERFYQQLASVQHGIERQSKLMLPNHEFYKNKVGEYFSSFNRVYDAEKLIELEKNKAQMEMQVLESYYRTHFWSPMLSYNQLSIYVCHNNSQYGGEPRIQMAKWDFDAISELSNYLSKRKIIGQYKLRSLDESEKTHAYTDEVHRTNFICVGSSAQPLGAEGPGLPEYIAGKIPGTSGVHKWDSQLVERVCAQAQIKGFCCVGDADQGYYTHIPQTQLREFYQDHPTGGDARPKIIFSPQTVELAGFAQDITGTHDEIAQLILWREDAKTPHDYNHYWVSIAGNSGPATLALSTILTDEEQRNAVCPGCSDAPTNFLCILQAEVRRQFMEHFLEKLMRALKQLALDKGWDYADVRKARQIEEYFDLVKYAVSFYLQTVLYRYFFPFLTSADMERIHNGMYTVVNSMKAAKVSPFALGYAVVHQDGYETPIPNAIVKGVVAEIPQVLLSALRRFKGLEVFYQVEVAHYLDDQDKDTRTIRNIQIMKRFEEPAASQVVNCFIMDD